jgi:uncharacterized protein (DUF488 family)
LEIWTIGHSTRTIDEFIRLLEGARIELVADVRKFPGSRRYPHFGQEQLERSLARAGIGYAHFPELGGRRSPQPDSPNTAWRNRAFRGYADYMSSEEFLEGMDRLKGMAKEKRSALMCAEAVWWSCHRSLIADYLKAAGWSVGHIMGEGKIQEHPYTSVAKVVAGQLSYSS